jgi:hypothetical protein
VAKDHPEHFLLRLIAPEGREYLVKKFHLDPNYVGTMPVSVSKDDS